MAEIRIAITGVGNCASLLLQGIEYYKDVDSAVEVPGLMHPVLGGYRIRDVTPVAAFDVSEAKVGKELSDAATAGDNINTERIASIPKSRVTVSKGPVLDGVGDYLKKVVSVNGKQAVGDVVKILKEAEAEVLINYLPVGSYEATRFYADAALKAGCAFINCIPEFISSDPAWARKFEQARLPIIGDDVKGQLGASILSRTLARLFSDRGCRLERMYQLNFGGNTDFINLLEDSRLKYKRISKTQTVQSVMKRPLEEPNIHIGPSDYVPWLRSRKIAYIRMEGRTFGDIPIHLDVKLDVEDKSVSAGVVIDAIRCAKLGLDRGIGGPLLGASAYFMKSPPQQFPDPVAKEMVDDFIRGQRER